MKCKMDCFLISPGPDRFFSIHAVSRVRLAGVFSLLSLFLSLMRISPVQAQPLFVGSSDPPEGASGVARSTRVSFHLNKPTPALGAQFAQRFFWSPADEVTLTRFGHDPAGADDEGLRTVFFDLEHAADTDVSFFVYGLRAGDGSVMTRPFTLNYTTAPSVGQVVVSGMVRWATETSASVTSGDAALRGLIRRNVQGPSKQHKTSKHQSRFLSERRGGYNLDVRRTVVLLLDQYALHRQSWHVRAATVLQDDGAFTFRQVRDGVYWPVAITWADADGVVIGAYGFYDADGDRTPNTITIGRETPDAVALSLFALAPATAASFLSVARRRAARMAPDQHLYEISAAGNAFHGRAAMWQYLFYSPLQDQITRVDVDPVNIRHSVVAISDSNASIRRRRPLPEPILDSDTVFDIAEAHGGRAYRAQFSEEVAVSLTAGDLDLHPRPSSGSTFWRVAYTSPVHGGEEKVLFIDAETGVVLDPVPVFADAVPAVPGRDALMQNYPNPFHSVTTITLELMRADAVSLEVFDLLGRKVTTLLDRRLEAGRHDVVWAGTYGDGRPAAPGVYLYRVKTNHFVSSRTMVLK